MPFQKGNPGRPKGSKNKVTRAVKEFLTELIDDPDVQAAVKKRVLDGEVLGFFKALEQVHGKPTMTVRATVQTEYVTTGGDDVAEED